MKKIGAVLLGILILISLVGLEWGAKYVAPYAIVKPTRIKAEPEEENSNFTIEDLTVTSFDSLQLRGKWIRPKDRKPAGLMILLHGINSCKEHMLGLSKVLLELNVASVIFDSRGHGESEGNYMTYGYYEKKDISNIIDQLESLNDSLPIGIWGNSMGGAIALQALEEDKRIKFGVIESTFRDLQEIIRDYQKNILGISLGRYTRIAMQEAERLATFEIDKVSPIKSVQHIHQPVLIAHGDHDEKIAVAYGKDLFRQLKSQDKELVIVKGGKHGGLMTTGGEEYKNKLMAFVERQFKP